ncbi:MAG: serine aminopeptidase domain-containing protein, partial [Candidatus Zixiibacteriota bacterium]
AYYRLRPVITDFHAAINEAGVIVVSAEVHRGWDNPKAGIIKQYKRTEPGHAFAVVGYNDKGFWVQNSWAKSWGNNGLALWTYEDWIANVMDAWVFRLALPTPQIFGMRPESSRLDPEREEKTEKSTVHRSRIAGHFVHIDDGTYNENGRYWSNGLDVEQTARLVASRPDYKHLLIYVHGGLNSPKDSARRIAAMKDVFKSNGVYPFHVMYDTGIAEELKDLIARKEEKAEKRVGGLSDFTDRFIEGLVRRPGKLLWDEMKQDARDAFAPDGAGSDALNRFVRHLSERQSRVKLHLVGHSTGGVVIAQLLQTMRRRQIRFSTCSLMAPACTVDLYEEAYLPVLRRQTRIIIDDLTVYNLSDRLERDDSVATIYRKSLLYLVSNAFELEKETAILGMEKFKDMVASVRSQPHIVYSGGSSGTRSRSRSHGGFDNDPYTMNHILRRVVGRSPNRLFSESDLHY